MKGKFRLDLGIQEPISRLTMRKMMTLQSRVIGIIVSSIILCTASTIAVNNDVFATSEIVLYFLIAPIFFTYSHWEKSFSELRQKSANFGYSSYTVNDYFAYQCHRYIEKRCTDCCYLIVCALLVRIYSLTSQALPHTPLMGAFTYCLLCMMLLTKAYSVRNTVRNVSNDLIPNKQLSTT